MHKQFPIKNTHRIFKMYRVRAVYVPAGGFLRDERSKGMDTL